jgi:hypothetical protein
VDRALGAASLGLSRDSSSDLVEALWKRQTAAKRSTLIRIIVRRGSERQAAADRSNCSRLTSRRSPVRAGHRPSSRATLRRVTAGSTHDHCCLSRKAVAKERRAEDRPVVGREPERDSAALAVGQRVRHSLRRGRRPLDVWKGYRPGARRSAEVDAVDLNILTLTGAFEHVVERPAASGAGLPVRRRSGAGTTPQCASRPVDAASARTGRRRDRTSTRLRRRVARTGRASR